jgi:hypothetical protein
MQGSDGERQAVEHGWAALSGGLYFGGDHKVLLSDVQMSGLPARMLQMYIGLPWTSTRMQAVTAKKEINQEREQASKAATHRATDAAAARERLSAAVLGKGPVRAHYLTHPGAMQAPTIDCQEPLCPETVRSAPRFPGMKEK